MAQPASDSPTLFIVQQKPDFSLEQSAMARGHLPVAGLDEAGRGPLAGPVVAAAVILDPDRIPAGLDDSKRLTPAVRDALFAEILATSRSMSIASVSSISIDTSDIRKASLEAMRRALAGLCTAPLLALVDGRDVPPGLSCAGRAVIKGDQISASIAAASILAKVTRDRMMGRCGAVDQRYGYERHMGYGTATHRAAIERHGAVVRLHRMSFAPMRLRDET